MTRALAAVAAAWALLGTVPALAQSAAPQTGAQFLYGSGEGGAMSRQIYRALEAFALQAAARRPADSVVLAADATLENPAWVPCGEKPLAVVFDVDETVSLNTGLGYVTATGQRPARGTPLATSPVPGAVEAIRALDAAGITAIYNTNRTVDMTELVVSTIAGFGLDRPVAGETLFLNGSDALGGNKDGRRATIAANWCVIAMAGDQLGDFTEMLKRIPGVTDRRRAALAPPIEAMWGNGWFLLPNTAYGTALEGSLDEVYPGVAPANDN